MKRLRNLENQIRRRYSILALMVSIIILIAVFFIPSPFFVSIGYFQGSIAGDQFYIPEVNLHLGDALFLLYLGIIIMFSISWLNLIPLAPCLWGSSVLLLFSEILLFIAWHNATNFGTYETILPAFGFWTQSFLCFLVSSFILLTWWLVLRSESFHDWS